MRAVEAIHRASKRILAIQDQLVKEWMASLTTPQLEALLTDLESGEKVDPAWHASLNEFVATNFHAALARHDRS